MAIVVGEFTIDDSFRITGRGLVLVGRFNGRVAPGHLLVLTDATQWRIKGIDFINLRNQQDKLGLWVDALLATREELVQHGIIGATVQVVAP